MSKLERLSESPAELSGPSREAIAQRAYQLWEERGKPHGSPDEDWHRAERQLRQLTHVQDKAAAASEQAE